MTARGVGRVFWLLNERFWQHGVGAMNWRKVRDSAGGGPWRALLVLVPNLRDGGMLPVLLYVSRTEKDWSMPGTVRAWNGSLERPTLEPSILVRRNHGDELVELWHGYVTAGDLVW